jgi:hypothetical protein
MKLNTEVVTNKAVPVYYSLLIGICFVLELNLIPPIEKKWVVYFCKLRMHGSASLLDG